MRKLTIVVGVLLVVHVALLFVRPSGSAQAAGGGRQTVGDRGVNVGIVLDVGGLGDKSFNDGAYTGAMRAEKELGAHIRLIEPGEESDRESGLRLLAAEHMNLVIGVGFIFTDDVTQLAKEYPDVNFAVVDYAIATDKAGNPISPPPNVAALKFKEEEGSFLVGALAALVSQSKKVGFVAAWTSAHSEVRGRIQSGCEGRVCKLQRDLTVRRRHADRVSEPGQRQGAWRSASTSKAWT
jgi:basic membrane protein A